MASNTQNKRLLVLVDSPKYIQSNCYQSQLDETLRRNFSVTFVSLRQIRFGLSVLVRPGKFDLVLSVLRQRTLDANLAAVRRFLGDTPVFVYDQDPWQAFMDDSPQRGCYSRIHQALSVQSFLTTSLWWSEFLGNAGFPSTFVRMGMLQRYCELGKPWEERPIALGFQGTLHPHRKVFFEALANMGVDVSVLPSQSYEGYLRTLHDIQIYIHTEDAPWMLNGNWSPRNALWIKDTEVAARGCFAIRDHEDESAAYGIGELPTIFTYRRVAEVPEIIAHIQAMPADERANRMRVSVDRMRERNDWMTVVSALDPSGDRIDSFLR